MLKTILNSSPDCAQKVINRVSCTHTVRQHLSRKSAVRSIIEFGQFYVQTIDSTQNLRKHISFMSTEKYGKTMSSMTQLNNQLLIHVIVITLLLPTHSTPQGNKPTRYVLRMTGFHMQEEGTIRRMRSSRLRLGLSSAEELQHKTPILTCSAFSVTQNQG